MSYDLGAIIAHVTADISGFKQGMDQVRDESKSFKDNFTDVLGKVGIAAGIATAAIAAVGTATFKLAEEAAQYNSIRDSFQSMTKGIVKNVDEFEDRVAKASGNTLDNLTILRGGTRALSLIGKDSFKDFGKDFEDMAMLSKKAARATGQDVNFMFDSLILGVSRSSKMILDNLGINIDVQQAYEDYAKTLGKSSTAIEVNTTKTAANEQKLSKLQQQLQVAQARMGEFTDKTSASTKMAAQFRLDNLNSQIAALTGHTTAYSGAAKITADDLTSQEQKAALLQAALKALHTNYDAVAVSAGGMQGGMQKLNTEFTNLRIELGQKLEPSFSQLIKTILPIIQEYGPQLIAVVEGAVQWFMNLDPFVRNTIIVFVALIPVVASVIGIVLALIGVLTALLNPIALLATAVTFLAAEFIANWKDISEAVMENVTYVKKVFNDMYNTLVRIGGQIEDAIKEPFNKAWESVKGVVDKIKNALDFTKRHSPSVLDVVKSGVSKVNTALSGLDYGITVTPHSQVAAIGVPSSGPGMGAIYIDMSGAIISDSMGAMRMGEIIGDNIIKKLNTQVRH